jgi:hypothetical protein
MMNPLNEADLTSLHSECGFCTFYCCYKNTETDVDVASALEYPSPGADTIPAPDFTVIPRH